MRRILTLSLMVGFLPGMSGAAWTGDVTQQVEKGAVVMGYQTASRDVENVKGDGTTVELKNRGLFLEQRTALNPVVQLALRALPFTGRVNLDKDSLDPHMAGAGVGLYAAPPEAFGPVRLGAAAVWDGAGGAQPRPNSSPKRYDRVYWSEMTLAAGASVSPLEFLNIYAGASFTSLRTRFSQAGAKATFKESSPWGGFGGVSLVSNKAWFANAEARAGGDRSFGASLGYKY